VTDPSATSNTAGASTTAATVAGTDSTSATHHAATSGAARGVPGPAPVFDQIAVSVNRAAADGLDHITIQLKPEALGRVDVHLQLGHDGRMTAAFVADRQDTLDMLQRDSRGLERALSDAGLRTDSGGLSFNLRGDGRDYAGLARDMAQGAQNSAGSGTAETTTTTDATRPARVTNGLLDISV
jgi:flagellar hook-length control protein FliK